MTDHALENSKILGTALWLEKEKEIPAFPPKTSKSAECS